jgi:hypothetical protein
MRSRVDRGARAGYHPAFRIPRRILAALPLLAAACAARGATRTEQPPDPALAREAAEATAPRRTLQILFDWSARERDARFSGRGVARVQPPYHARLDLFGPRGEAYLTAALVDDDLRLPPATREAPVPPPPLLWSVLGVFWPPPGAELRSTTRDGGTVRLEYGRGAERWFFRLEGGRLRFAEWRPAEGGRHTVDLQPGEEDGPPRQAVYRDWAAFAELVLTLDSVEDVPSFSPDIWAPHEP